MSVVLALCLLLLLLPGCGRLDAYATFAPEAIRLPKPVNQRLPDPEPEAARLVRDGLDSVFLKGANPRNVKISKPRRDPSSTGWTVCLKATTTTVGGHTRAVTLVVYIVRGELDLRRPAEPNDGCESEDYARL
jgi:hypothetical protein